MRRELIGMGNSREDGMVTLDGDTVAARDSVASTDLRRGRSKSAAKGRTKASAADARLEQELGSIEIIDDPVRMYLRGNRQGQPAEGQGGTDAGPGARSL